METALDFLERVVPFIASPKSLLALLVLAVILVAAYQWSIGALTTLESPSLTSLATTTTPAKVIATQETQQAPSPQAAATATPTWEERRAQNRTIDYRELFRNNEHYIGQHFYFRGKIVQVIERGEDTYDFRVDVDTESLSSAIVYLAEYTGQ